MSLGGVRFRRTLTFLIAKMQGLDGVSPQPLDGFMAPIHVHSLEVVPTHAPCLFEWGARPSRLHRSASRRPEPARCASTRVRRDAELGRRDARAPHRTFSFMAAIHIQSLEVFPTHVPVGAELNRLAASRSGLSVDTGSTATLQLNWGAHAPSRAVVGAFADHTGARERITVS